MQRTGADSGPSDKGVVPVAPSVDPEESEEPVEPTVAPTRNQNQPNGNNPRSNRTTPPSKTASATASATTSATPTADPTSPLGDRADLDHPAHHAGDDRADQAARGRRRQQPHRQLSA
nr:hypothetical protein GCM10020092_089280 [Actinoplanes digitatis]